MSSGSTVRKAVSDGTFVIYDRVFIHGRTRHVSVRNKHSGYASLLCEQPLVLNALQNTRVDSF